MYRNWQHVADTACLEYQAQQEPSELGVLLAILAYQAQPSTVLEIGTGSGGSTWAWAQVPTVNRIITIDISPVTLHFGEITARARLDYIVGRSQAPETRVRVSELLGADSVDMLYVDGAHDTNAVTTDLILYTDLVARGGLVVLHDTQGFKARDDFHVGPVFAKLRKQYRSLELVANPGGPAGTGLLWMPSA